MSHGPMIMMIMMRDLGQKMTENTQQLEVWNVSGRQFIIIIKLLSLKS